MIKRILPLLMATFLTTSLHISAESYRPGPNTTLPHHARLYPINPTIKVLLAKDVTSAIVEVKGPYRVFDLCDENVTSHGIFGKCYPINATQDGLKWGEGFPGMYQIAIVPASTKTTISVDGVSYPGSIFVYQIGNKVNLVNQVKIEDYLKATLSSRLDSNLKDEALAAAVITARTDAYYQAVLYPKAHFNVEASQVSYHGNCAVRTRAVEQAVDATRFLVMRSCDSDENSGLFPAAWTEHSAGKTASSSVMFRKASAGSFTGVQSVIAANDRESCSWTFLSKKCDLAKFFGMKDLNDLSIYKDDASGKVYGVRLQGSSDSRDIDFLTFQKSLGAQRIQSSDFSVEVQGDIVAFTGYGKGHGVGLCLYSANRLSEHGQDAVKVLGKFFPGTEVVMMPSIRTQPATAIQRR